MSFKVEKLDSPAPMEPNISTEHPWTDVIFLDALRTQAQSWNSLLKEYLEGTSNVDIVAIELKLNLMEEKQHCFVGFQEVGGSVSTKALAGKSSGLRVYSNPLKLGDELYYRFIPEDNMSRQIRPQSSLLPEMKFCTDISEDAQATFTIKIKVNGVRYRFLSLN
jgi:hypothetical protein